jgi:hypothetical protein
MGAEVRVAAVIYREPNVAMEMMRRLRKREELTFTAKHQSPLT